MSITADVMLASNIYSVIDERKLHPL
jgi:hypothetical protein